MKTLVVVVSNTIALAVSEYVVPGFIINPELSEVERIFIFLVGGLILGILNSVLKPFLLLIALPAILLSLGLGLLLLNMALLWILDVIIPDLSITGFWSYFWAVILIGLVNITIQRMTSPPKKLYGHDI